MFGNFGDMAKLMALAKDLPGKMKQIRAELAESVYEATSPCGAVTAAVSGDLSVKKIEFNATPTPGAVEAAVNAAIIAAKAGIQEKMREASGGLDLPNIF